MGLGDGPNPNGSGEGFSEACFTRQQGDQALRVPPKLRHVFQEGREWKVSSSRLGAQA